MEKPVYTSENPNVAIASFGKLVAFDPRDRDTRLEGPLATIEKHALALGAHSVIVQRLSNRPDCLGRFMVLPRSVLPYAGDRLGFVNNYRMNGLILRNRHEAAGFITRDCGTLIVSQDKKYTRGKTTPVFIAHISRDSIQGTMLGKPEASVVTNGMSICLPEWDEPGTLRATITLCIAAEHFPNNQHPQIVAELRNRWGDEVVPDQKRSTIDLVAVVRAQLREFGMRPEQITHDKLDTYSDTRLASKRRGDEIQHNVVLVKLK